MTYLKKYFSPMSEAVTSANTQAEKSLWTPRRDGQSRLEQFIKYIAPVAGQEFSDYASVHAWSIREPEKFWNAVWDFSGMIGDKGKEVITEIDHVPFARFFSDS